jgi:type II secretory pathway component GspD/PulD (secretin)
MDIPLLGYAFRNTSAKEIRNELIVLIRPTVLPTPEIAAQAAQAEKRAMPGVNKTEREFRTEQGRSNRKDAEDIPGGYSEFK